MRKNYPLFSALLFLCSSFSTICRGQVDLSSGLVAHYTFDGNTKNSVSSTSFPDLTNYYSAGQTADHFGHTNSAYSFNGTSYLAGSSSNSGFSGETISAWVNTTYTAQQETVMQGYGFVMYVNRFTAGHFMAAFDGATGNNASTDESSSNVESGWTLLTATSDGSTTRLYVNGKFENSYSETLVTGNQTFVIGNQTNGSWGFNGAIDDVRIYNRMISAKEALAIYEDSYPAFGTSGNACYGKSVKFTDSSINTASVNYLWKFGDFTTSSLQNPTHAYYSTGTKTVWLYITNGAGGVDSTSRTVTIYPLPSASFNVSANGLEVQCKPNYQPNVSYHWDFGDSNTSTSVYPIHTYSNYGSYTITLTTSNQSGCDSSATKTVTFKPDKPVASFISDNACAGKPVQFTNSSTSKLPLTYLWSFGNGATSTIANPVYTYTNPGTDTITLIATDSYGSSDTLVRTVTVFALPTVSFTTTQASNKVNFTPSANNFASYLWDFGDNLLSNQANPEHIYNSFGNFTVSLTVTNANGCSTTYSNTITVYEIPKAIFDGANVCNGMPVEFIDSSVAEQSLVYSWNFGDHNASKLQNPAHLYQAPGKYTVSLKVTTPQGYSDSTTRQVTVYQLPSASFSDTSKDNKAFFAPADSTLQSYNWDFGDSNFSFAQRPVHIYDYYGNFRVILKTADTHGCESSDTESLTISKSGIEGNVNAKPGFVLYPDPVSDGRLTVSINNMQGQGEILIFDMEGKQAEACSITNLNGNIQKTIDVSTLRPGIYMISLTSIDGIINRKIVVR